MNQHGTITAQAIATDAAGNTGQASTTIRVMDPTDSEGPVINLDLSAITNGVITAPREIKGTVTTPTWITTAWKSHPWVVTPSRKFSEVPSL